MNVTEKKLMGWLSVAKKAALLAGSFLVKNSHSDKKINVETGKDIKINSDVESEKIIIDYLKKKSEFSILSEEKGLTEGKVRDIKWVVDPLDGTMNYFKSIPFCCVSIGLWRNDEPLLGVVYDFNGFETFSGIVKKAAWNNDKKITVSATNKKQKAVLCTGFPVNTDFSKSGIKQFIVNAASYKKIRLLGSAALSIAYVASGRFDAYDEKDIMFWDIAGAIPILLAAGGKVNMAKAAKEYSYNVYAYNGYF